MAKQHITAIACAMAMLAGSANAAVLLVPQNTNMTNSLGGGWCAPACTSTQQEMLSSDLFSSPVNITGISLYVMNPYGYSWAPSDLTLKIGTTNVPIANMTQAVSSNLTNPLTDFASLHLSGTPKSVDELLFANSGGFLYDPTQGNLMIQIANSAPRSVNALGPGFQIIYSNGTQSREVDQFTSTSSSVTGVGDSIRYSVIYTPAVPEPSTFAMAALGLVSLIGVARTRRHRMA